MGRLGTAPSQVAVVVGCEGGGDGDEIGGDNGGGDLEAVAAAMAAAVAESAAAAGPPPLPSAPTRHLHPVGRVSIGPGCCITSFLLNLALLAIQ